MILGMSVANFTLLHVVLSLIRIFAGFIVLFGMFFAKQLKNWTALFLATTVLTSVTGFLSLREFRRAAYTRRSVVGDPGALCLSPRRGLALDLCHRRRVGISEVVVFATAGADAIRTAVRYRSSAGVDDLRRARHCRAQIVSPREQDSHVWYSLNIVSCKKII